MAYKPSDFYIGVVEFFAVLLPGAGAAYLLMAVPVRSEDLGLAPVTSSASRWFLFAGAAYALGHILFAVGSAVLDPSYDRWYAKCKRLRRGLADRVIRWNEYLLKKGSHSAKLSARDKRRLRRLKRRVKFAACWKNRDGFFQPDPLLATARTLQRASLAKVAKLTGVKSMEGSTTFLWAGSEIRAAGIAGVTEVESLMANSKFFRSMTVLLSALSVFFLIRYLAWPLVVPGPDAFDLGGLLACLLTLVAVPFCWWRFAKLRWDATKLTYQYLISLKLALDPEERRG